MNPLNVALLQMTASGYDQEANRAMATGEPVEIDDLLGQGTDLKSEANG